MNYAKLFKNFVLLTLVLVIFLGIFAGLCPKGFASGITKTEALEEKTNEKPKKFIKWVDFNASYEIMKKVSDLDIKTKNDGIHFRFIDTLAYIAFKNGNNFNLSKDLKTLENYIQKRKSGQSIQDLTKDNKYFLYYLEAFNAIFAELMGERAENGSYGIKLYSPIGKGYYYTDCDDFGNSRSFGYKRVHLGHDMFGSIGTPIVAVEGGTITEFGWNRYGGWRIGIRSNDTKRYYYYAHLRRNKPYAENLKKGDKVEAGQLIGYLGCTGYSFKENTNMKTTKPHLHFGMQLIFDKSQEDGKGEIWIDVYQIIRLLKPYRSLIES